MEFKTNLVRENKNYKPYPEYKDSGVEWIGEVPKHWNIKKLKFCMKLKTTKNYSNNFVIALENIESWTGRYIETSNEYSNEGINFENGDILFGKLRPYLAKVYLAQDSGTAIGDFFVFQPIESSKFLFYLMLSKPFIQEANSFTFGAKMPRVAIDFIENFQLPIPNSKENEHIISFLDYKTSKIDQLIQEKQELIELLKKKKTALITKCVTKGLDENVEMKDSGVEYLGNIPEHWEVVKLKRVCTINPSKKEVHNKDIEVSFLSMDKIYTDGNYDYTSKNSLEEVYNGFTYFKEKDIGIAKITPCFENFKGAYFDKLHNGIGFGTTELHILRAQKRMFPKFIFYWTKTEAFIKYGKMEMSGVAGQQRVSEGFVLNFQITLPNYLEQQKIVDHLDHKTSKIDQSIQEIQESIDYLKRYRTSLITAAVTGKIDVRDWEQGEITNKEAAHA